jgi:hypothetical protein
MMMMNDLFVLFLNGCSSGNVWVGVGVVFVALFESKVVRGDTKVMLIVDMTTRFFF